MTNKTPDFVNVFRNGWCGTKKFKAYSIVVQPNDSACLNIQRAQFGQNGNYGRSAHELSKMTNAQSVSICESDYSGILTSIGQDMTKTFSRDN